MMPILTVLFLSTTMLMCANSNQELFLRGHQLYDQKEYENALHSYESIANKGAAVWYNMGNCTFQLQQFDQALICWLRAYRRTQRRPLRAVIEKNIQKLPDDLSTLFEIHPWEQQFGNISLFILQFILIALWVSFLWVSFGWYRKRRYILLVCFLILIVVTGGAIALKYRIKHKQYGILQKESVICAGPNKSYHIKEIVPSIQQVTICDRTDTWYKIARGHLVGWVEADTLTEI